MEKIYISGKITGIEDEAEKLFAEAEIILREMGCDPINPFTLNHEHDKSWKSYMAQDIKALVDCDTMFMLSNWKNSTGARIERKIAKYLGIKIRYEESPSSIFKKLLVLPTWILTGFCRPLFPANHAWIKRRFSLEEWADNANKLNISFAVFFWLSGILNISILFKYFF